MYRGDIRRIVEHFGEEPQIRQTMEECAELIVALNKYLRYEDDPERRGSAINDIFEEMADVYVMIEQLKFIFGDIGETEHIAEGKVLRTLERIREEKA